MIQVFMAVFYVLWLTVICCAVLAALCIVADALRWLRRKLSGHPWDRVA